MEYTFSFSDPSSRIPTYMIYIVVIIFEVNIDISELFNQALKTLLHLYVLDLLQFHTQTFYHLLASHQVKAPTMPTVDLITEVNC